MSKFPGKTVLIIAGPTGVGKTAIAIQLAKHFNTDIISADSRQCFKELNIGVARPSVVELAAIPHHFIATHSIHEEVNAAVFEEYALQKTAALFQRHDVVIMAGGTGLYIKAFCGGLDDIPAAKPEVRNKIIELYERQGLQWLQNEVAQKDPAFYAVGEIQNPQRLMRALEIVESTGRSVLDFRKGKKTTRGFRIIKIGLELPREELHRNIDTRVDKMMEAGLMDEVKAVQSFQHLNALQTVGYSELFAFLDAKISLDEAVDLIKKNTRQYAKRQMTWFRKDPEIQWFLPREIENIQKHLAATMAH